MMSISVIEKLADLAALRQEWDALGVETDASPYTSYDWVSTSIELFGHGQALSVVVVRDGRGLLAILPLEHARERVALLTQPVLRLAGRWIPAAAALIAPRAPVHSIMSAVFERLRGSAPWTYCRLVRLPAGSPLLADLGPDAGAGGVRRVCVGIGRSVVIQVPGSWAEYRASLSPAHRKNLARRTNGLARRGPLRMERLPLRTPLAATAVEPLLSDALQVSRRSRHAHAVNGRSICAADVVDFVRRVSQRLAAQGALDLSVLYCGDRPVSFIWGAARWPRSTIEKMGFDAEFAEHSPGLVHVGRLVADSVERGITAIDFGHEFAEHKSHWGEPQVPLYDVLYYPATLKSRFICWWRHDRRRAAAPTLAAAPAAADCVLGMIG